MTWISTPLIYCLYISFYIWGSPFVPCLDHQVSSEKITNWCDQFEKKHKLVWSIWKKAQGTEKEGDITSTWTRRNKKPVGCVESEVRDRETRSDENILGEG